MQVQIDYDQILLAVLVVLESLGLQIPRYGLHKQLLVRHSVSDAMDSHDIVGALLGALVGFLDGAIVPGATEGDDVTGTLVGDKVIGTEVGDSEMLSSILE